MAGRKRIQYQSVSAPVFTPPPPTAVVTSAASSQITFKNKLIYQSKTEPAFVPPPILGTWQYAWSTPVRQRIAAGLAIAMIASGSFAPVPIVVEDQPNRWFQALSEPVRTKNIITALHPSYFAPTMIVPEYVLAPGVASPQVNIQHETRFQYQAVAYPLIRFDIPPPDRWNYPWSEPVRVKRFSSAQQTAAVAPVLVPAPPPVAIVSTVSSQVTFKGRLIYQAKTEPAFVPTIETITPDKWIYAWSEPVRQKIGLRAHLQQAFIAPVLDPNTQITQDYESRWHYAWSEPVRLKPQVPAGEQQSFTSDPSVLPTKNLPTWFYSWSEPVRQLAGLRAYLQQAFIAPVLNPDTQITQTYESRWHYAWSEPVRVRQFPTSEQQSFAFQPPKFEIITVDKWNYAWSEPVRQKPGLKAHLQQSLIATTLDPDTQITQGYESRWHYAWSEPVRTRLFQTAQQQSFTFQPPSFEIIQADKWTYPWSEPVRQKPGLRAHLQQAFIGTVLNPDTQITQGYESRWHYTWSEPVRTRLFQTAQQQSFAFVLNPETQIIQGYESRWHYAWSEPVRTRLFPAADQQTFTFQPPSFEIITVDKWGYAWSEPVRQKPGLRANLQQAFIGTVLDDAQILQTYESPWHQPWSEPVRVRRFPAAEHQTRAFVFAPLETITLDKWFSPLTLPVRLPAGLKSTLQQSLVTTIGKPIITVDRWGYGWSEPVRKKLGLGAWLQQASILQTPPFPNFIKTINWFSALNEPVRLKRGIPTYLQRFFEVSQEPPPLNLVTLNLSGLEINSDSALFGVLVYSGVLPTTPTLRIFVSIEEIKAENAASVSLDEIKINDSGAVSIEET